MTMFAAGARVTLQALEHSRAVVLGGSALDGARHMWWNFVSSAPQRIERAKADWREGRFTGVPGDPGFIPLPDS